MKRIIQILSIVLGLSATTYGTNLPNIGGTISQNKMNAGSNGNFFLLSVDDGDASINQNMTITGVSSDPSLLTVTSVDFNSANTFATFNIDVTDIPSITGIVTVTVSAMDEDGTSTKKFAINIGDYYTKGVTLKVYDIVFWQHIVPNKQLPKMDVVITTTSIPQEDEFYKPAKLTVGAGAVLLPWYPNDWANFFTNALSGYIKPPVSGVYTFKNVSQDSTVFFLGTLSGGNLISATPRIECNGTSCGLNINTFSIYLEEGKYYPFHTADWLVFTKNYQLLWTGPGITMFEPIGGSNVYPLYDRQNPSTPVLSLVNKGVQFLTLKWKSSVDDDQVAGYNLYKNGVKLASLNDSLFVVTALGANTLYSFAVTSYDRVGNESLISNILSTSTYAPDAIPPIPPTTITFLSKGDMSAEISWSGASDDGSEVIGYYVYLNGNLYNPQYTTGNTMVLQVLAPLTNYTVSVEAIDGAFNRSPKSSDTAFTTLKFDETFKSVGVKKAKHVFAPTAIARNAGFGLNIDWKNPDYYNKDKWYVSYINDLQPGLIRWGSLPANPTNLSEYVGTGKPVTIGKFIKFCSDNNAYAGFSCGVENSTDWRQDPATFTRFMEYIGDPTGQTPGGAIRISEGYIEPLIDANQGIVFEFGNEVWGAADHNAQIGADYVAYGKWCRDMAAVIKSSPYYNPAKIFLLYSGDNLDLNASQAKYVDLFTGEHHEVDWLSISGYMGGNLNYDTKVPEGATQLQYYQSGTSIMLEYLRSMQDVMDLDIQLTGKYRPFYFYEGNMSTPDYNGHLGQAVEMCDYFMSSMKLGGVLPAIFTLSGGEWSLTDASNGNAKLPFFNLAELMNANTKGNILRSEVKSVEFLDNGGGLKIGGDPVGIHVFNNGTQYAMALFSRDFDSDYQVQLVLPKNGAYSGTAQKYVITGEDFNTRAAISGLTTETFKDSMIVTVPKYSALLYVFDGPDLGLPLLPIGTTKYRKIDQVTIKTLSESSDIVAQYGSVVFTVTAVSLTVQDNRIGWDIAVPDGLDVSVDTTNGIRIFGSGTCEGNGVVTITAFSMEDPNVKDQKLVTITGQLTEGLESCTEGITENSINGKVAMYPNPTDGGLNLFSNALQMNEVKIYNSSGSQVFNKTLQSGLQSHQLQLNHLSSGLYLVKINTSKGVVSRKVRIN